MHGTTSDTLSDWDDDYARAASQLRTFSTPNRTNHSHTSSPHHSGLRDRSGQATSVRSGLDRLQKRLSALRSGRALGASEAGRRQNLIDGLKNQLGHSSGGSDIKQSDNSGHGRSSSSGSDAMSNHGKNPNEMSSSAAAMQRQDDLIDDLAVGVSRLKDQTHAIHDEAHHHVRLLDQMDQNVDLANQGLEDETRRALRLKEEGSVWRLYGIIAGLSVLLFLLVLMGLS